ncbi:PRA1 family protein-domain-containing protein [Obelidium mucronatum]|nr:PRA1 family protein-domain-containing protein [Obelidium mucronatum]
MNSILTSQLGKYIPVDSGSLESLQQATQQRMQSLKPWSEFFDRSRFSVPASYTEFSVRCRLNWQHFHANYLLVSFIAVAWSLLTNWWLLFDVIFIFVGSRYVSTLPANEPTHLFNNASLPLITQTQGWLGLGLAAAILLYISAAGSAIFWIVVFVGIIVAGHAGVMEAPLEVDFGETV